MEDAYGNKVSHCSRCEIDTIDGVDERGLCDDCVDERELATHEVMQEITSPYWKTNDVEGGVELEDRTWRMIEFSARPFIERIEQYTNIYLEAADRVHALRREGHSAARAVIDLFTEVAYTCDECGLWQFTSHKAVDLKDSAEECHGDLFGSPCSKRVVIEKYGKIDYAALLAEPSTEYGEDRDTGYKRTRKKKPSGYANRMKKKGQADAPTTT